jgi:hypothetical protein
MGEFMANFWFNVKRTWVDSTVLLAIIAAIFFLPPPESGLLTLAIAKVMFISAGILHAHITRKIMWSYIDFNKPDCDIYHKIMVIAWYVVIIWGWARGG